LIVQRETKARARNDGERSGARLNIFSVTVCFNCGRFKDSDSDDWDHIDVELDSFLVMALANDCTMLQFVDVQCNFCESGDDPHAAEMEAQQRFTLGDEDE
jgi:hypothetical protein